MSRGRTSVFVALCAVVALLAAACTSDGVSSKVQRRLEAGENAAEQAAEQACEAAVTAGVAVEAACEASEFGGYPHPENIMEHLNGYFDFFYGPRMAPGKRIPVGALQAAIHEAERISSLSRGVSVAAASNWVDLGPKPINSEDPAYQDPVVNNYGAGWGIDSGRVTAVTMHPQNNNTVYVGTADGGVWRTTNAGATWAQIGNSLGTQAIGAIGIARTNPNTLYVGTGEASTSSDSYFGLGVFKSTNGGTSFTKVGGTLFDRKTVFKVLVPTNGDYVLVATNQGLYRSQNGGGTWTQVLAPGNSVNFENFITDVIARNNTGSNLVAAIGWRQGRPTNGLYTSTNSGTTWTALGSPPGFTPQSRIGRVTLARAPSNPNLLFAVVQDAQYFNLGGPNGTVLNGVYRSTAGPSGPWTLVADSLEFESDPGSAMDRDKIGGGFGPGVQAWYNQYVHVDPTNPNHVIVGLEEIYESTNGGLDWDTIGRYWNFCYANPPWPESPWCNSGPGTEADTKTTHPDQHDAAFTSTGNLFAGSDGGMYFQSGPNFDNDSWQNLNRTIGTAQCYFGDISGDGTILCGTQDNGTVKYVGGDEWPVVTGGDGGDSAIEPQRSSNMWAEYVFLTMFNSDDGGVTWDIVGPPDDNPRFISPYEMDPLDPQHLVAGGQQIWNTTDGVDTESDEWTVLYDLGSPRQATAIGVRGNTAYAAWCSPAACNPASFAGTGVTFGLATNVGGSWHEPAGSGLPNRYITSVVIDPGNVEHIWVTVSAFSRRWIPSAGIGHVFESTNGGQTFANRSSNLPDIPANDLVLYNGRVIVGTDVGVFERAPNGNWFVLGNGLPAVSVLDLAVKPGGGILTAFTHGRGVWQLPLDA
jgi:hypothetical protein